MSTFQSRKRKDTRVGGKEAETKSTVQGTLRKCPSYTRRTGAPDPACSSICLPSRQVENRVPWCQRRGCKEEVRILGMCPHKKSGRWTPWCPWVEDIRHCAIHLAQPIWDTEKQPSSLWTDAATSEAWGVQGEGPTAVPGGHGSLSGTTLHTDAGEM